MVSFLDALIIIVGKRCPKSFESGKVLEYNQNDGIKCSKVCWYSVGLGLAYDKGKRKKGNRKDSDRKDPSDIG
jgi:hypothetical protein